jgi:hypothetical protein
MPTMRCTFPLLPRHVGNPGRVVVYRLLVVGWRVHSTIIYLSFVTLTLFD